MKAKICGFTVPEHLADAAGLGLDYAGLVLWQGSPRVILSRERARELTSYARGVGVESVGVFVDEPTDAIATLAEEVHVDIVQLHGDRPVSDVAALVACGLRVWQALRTGPHFDANQARQAWAAGAEVVLLDAWHPTEPGGTGTKADWEQAALVAREGRVMLAGGLTAENVAEAIAAVRPWGVDVSSSLEQYPGFKDHFKVRAFLDAVRRA